MACVVNGAPAERGWSADLSGVSLEGPRRYLKIRRSIYSALGGHSLEGGGTELS